MSFASKSGQNFGLTQPQFALIELNFALTQPNLSTTERVNYRCSTGRYCGRGRTLVYPVYSSWTLGPMGLRTLFYFFSWILFYFGSWIMFYILVVLCSTHLIGCTLFYSKKYEKNLKLDFVLQGFWQNRIVSI